MNNIYSKSDPLSYYNLLTGIWKFLKKAKLINQHMKSQSTTLSSSCCTLPSQKFDYHWNNKIHAYSWLRPWVMSAQAYTYIWFCSEVAHNFNINYPPHCIRKLQTVKCRNHNAKAHFAKISISKGSISWHHLRMQISFPCFQLARASDSTYSREEWRKSYPNS